ncbi:hypothetical protein [Nocardioides donggukensis]|uniref:Uncharacterized protein n=1 Tax=Nocardioides donggukensis TaxID=2774019 RepID=A0A927K9X8_9ACTN|nr:hypothetical protein [Nocardioides donggukensis]MBD8870340.1 hypothetical protein [Nocardioides donggukensis]
MASTYTPLIRNLDVLHAAYIDAVNAAAEAGDLTRALELAEAYDTDATLMVAEHEGKTHMLPLRRRGAAA